MNPQLLSLLVVSSAALVLIALEHRFPYTRGQRLLREGFLNDFAFYTILQSYVLGLVITAVIDLVDGAAGFAAHRPLSGWPFWVQLLFFLFLHDLYIYWFHRWQHHSPRLWRIHEAHHSTRDVDWLSGSRSHSLEILINQTVEFLPIMLLTGSTELFVVKASVDAVWGMWIHSNIDVRTGWLQYIINGPEMHRWHHATDTEAHNRNFGTKFAFWDWLFGTAWLPQRPRKPMSYGLDESYPNGYIAQHLYAFRPLEEGASSQDSNDGVGEAIGRMMEERTNSPATNSP